MSLRSLLGMVRNRKVRPNCRSRRHLALEGLETRLVPTIAMVDWANSEFDCNPPGDFQGPDGNESLAEAAVQLNFSNAPTNILQFGVSSVDPGSWSINVPVTLLTPDGSLNLGGGTLVLNGGADLSQLSAIRNGNISVSQLNGNLSNLTLDHARLQIGGSGGTLDGITARNGSEITLTYAMGITLQNSNFTDSGISVIGAQSFGNKILDNDLHGNSDSYVLLTGYSSGTMVRGNTIWNNDGDADLVLNDSSNNQIEENRLGTDETGMFAFGSASYGILSKSGCDNNLIRANLISGNKHGGIDLAFCHQNTIVGNDIGVDESGNNPLPNGTAGDNKDVGGIYLVGGSGNTVGGTADNASNVISANYGNSYLGAGFAGGGITIGESGDLVEGNWIGTDQTGKLPGLGNYGPGVMIVKDLGSNNIIQGNTIGNNHGDGLVAAEPNCLVKANYIGTNADGASLPNDANGLWISSYENTIQDNEIANNGKDGILIAPRGSLGDAHDNQVLGNTIVDNQQDGLAITHESSNIIGPENFLWSNSRYGVFIDGADASNNVVDGNEIGFKGFGNRADGVHIHAPGNTVGGPRGNLIAFNYGTSPLTGAAGVTVDGFSGNAILGNRIHDNDDTPEIQLINDANSNRNPPVIVSATLANGALTILARLDASSGFQQGVAYTVQFFANSVADAGGGPGEVFLAETTSFDSATYFEAATVTVDPPPDGETLISATVTDPNNNTSRFSQCVQISLPPLPPGGHAAPRFPLGLLGPGAVLSGSGLSEPAMSSAIPLVRTPAVPLPFATGLPSPAEGAPDSRSAKVPRSAAAPGQGLYLPDAWFAGEWLGDFFLQQ